MAALQSLMLRVVYSFTISALVTSPVYAEFVPRFDGRTFGIELTGEYYTTEENLDGTDGSREAIIGDSFDTFSVKGAIDYSIKRNWIVGAGAEIVNATSSNSNTFFNNLDADRSATEFNNASIFTRLQLQAGTLRLVPSLYGTWTLQEVNRNTNDVITGEGANQAELGAWAIIEAGALEPYAYAGYRYQEDGRAHLMPWRVGSQVNLAGFFFRGELGGHLTLRDDEFTANSSARRDVTNRVNAGSYRYYSVDPNLIEARLEGGIPASRELEIVGGATHTLAGESVAYGYSLYLGIRYSQNPKDRRDVPDSELAERIAEDNAAAATADRDERREKVPPAKRAPKRAVKKNEFTPQLEDYDPAMFEKEMNKKKKPKQ
jgi:hypothetical protein